MRIKIADWLLVILTTSMLAGCSGGSTPPVSPLSVAAATLPQATTSAAYSATFTATGGTSPYTWSVVAGSTMPPGLTLSMAGVIAGTPTTAGTYPLNVQVTDSESTPASATTKATLAVSGGKLGVAAAPPPSGTIGIPYSFTFAATGGVPPYTWSVASGTLPAGLTLNAGTGVLSGAPTTAGTSAPVIQVADSASSTAQQNFSISIVAAGTALPQGDYSFMFRGFGPKGGIALDGYFVLAADQSVAVGKYDKNTIAGPPQTNQAIPISGGSVQAGNNGIATLNLTLADGTSVAFAVAIPTGIGTTGVESTIPLIEFDDKDGTGTRGAGVMKFTATSLGESGFKGSFAFGLSGVDSASNRVAIAGSIQADGAGNITGGEATENDNGTVTTISSITGTYSFDATGRAQMKVNLNGSAFNYSFYQASQAAGTTVVEFFVAGVDQVSTTVPLLTGSMYQQTGPFTAASLKGVDVLALSGLAHSASTAVSDNTLGLVTSDGTANVSFSLDENKNGLQAPQTYTGTYTVDQSGKVAITAAGTPPTMYLINSAQALVVGADASASFGVANAQSGTPFTAGSFKGTYLGGTTDNPQASVVNLVQQLVVDGSNGVSATESTSGPSGLQSSQTTASTYAVDATGRIVLTQGGSRAGILYVVSPTQVFLLSTSVNGSLSTYTQ